MRTPRLPPHQAQGLLPADVLETQVDPAAFELSGHLVLKRAVDFDAVSEDFCWRILECASLDEVRFAARTRAPCTACLLSRSRKGLVPF